MKRFFPVFLIVLLIIALVSVGTISLFSLLFAPQDSIIHSLPDYESKEFYSSGGFQDYTDYGKYIYRISETALVNNPYFLQVTETDIPKICSYIDDFENWVEISSDFPKERYDFDASQITPGDYFYISNRYEAPEKKFWSYNVYYFDLSSGILYFFHNNI